MTPEQKVKREISDYLAHQPNILFWYNAGHGLRGYKNNSKYQRNGTSDILGIWNGRFLAVEVKAPGGKASPEQIEFIRDINLYGGFAITADSVEFLDEAMAAHASENNIPLNRLKNLRGLD